jgi:hypothetical protein
MLSDNFELLTSTFEADWKHFESDLVESGNPKRPQMSLETAMKYLMYSCPICNTWGMCAELCNVQVSTCKRTSLLWPKKDGDPQKAAREAAYKVWKSDPARQANKKMHMDAFLKSPEGAGYQKPGRAGDEAVYSNQDFYDALVLKQSLVKAHPALPLR